MGRRESNQTNKISLDEMMLVEKLQISNVLGSFGFVFIYHKENLNGHRVSIKDLGQFPIQSDQILAACC